MAETLREQMDKMAEASGGKVEEVHKSYDHETDTERQEYEVVIPLKNGGILVYATEDETIQIWEHATFRAGGEPPIWDLAPEGHSF